MESEVVATLGDFVDLVRGTTYQGALVGKPGPALLGLGSIRPGGGFRDDDFKTYGGDCPPKLMLTPGDLFASLKGATKDGEMIGSVARVPTSVHSGRLTQDTVKLVFRRRDNDVEQFVYWVLRTPQYRAYCAGRATGSAVVALSRNDFLAYPIPTLTGARMHCVRLLETIEQRIALLRQTNATLEAIAQALFKSWFIDFDPVRAKAEGREPEGMDATTAALFPDKFEESASGLIPNAWRPGALTDVADLNALSWTTKRAPSEIAYVDLAGVKSNVFDPVQRLTFGAAPSRARRELRAGDTLVGTVRPGNRSFGFISEAEAGLTGSTGFAVLSPREPEATTFTYLCATRDANIERLASLADGGAYPAVRPELVIATSCVLPAQAVLVKFASITEPLMRSIGVNAVRAQTLADTRDTLLPRLITGKLRLPEAQEQFEDDLA